MSRKKTKKEKHVNHFGVGLLLGAAAGYAVSYLTASKAGEELQNELSEKAHIWKNKATEKVEEIKQKTGMEQEEAGVPVSEPTHPLVPTENVESEIILAEANERAIDRTVEKGIPLP